MTGQRPGRDREQIRELFENFSDIPEIDQMLRELFEGPERDSTDGPEETVTKSL